MKKFRLSDDAFEFVVQMLVLIALGALVTIILTAISLTDKNPCSYILPEVYLVSELPNPPVVEEEFSIDEEEEAMNTLFHEYIEELKVLDKINDREKWFRKYKEINAKYAEIGSADTIYDFYPVDDLQYLWKAVETECFGAGFEAKANVAQVIMNRVDSDRYPSTFKSVVTQPNQFAYGRDKITEETKLACEYAFAIGDDELKHALFFHSGAKTEKFNGASHVKTDNVNHHFYE